MSFVLKDSGHGPRQPFNPGPVLACVGYFEGAAFAFESKRFHFRVPRFASLLPMKEH